MSFPSSLRPKTNPNTPESSNQIDVARRGPSSLRLKKEEESLPQNINRQFGRTGARIFETALGAPRAIGEFLESIIPEKLITKGAEKIGLGEPVKKGYEVAKKYAPYKLFPKSEEVRDVFKLISGGKTEPKNEWEAKADEVISDFTALAMPLPGHQLKLLKPGLLALGGNVASDLVGQLGGGEKEKTYAKLGTFVLGSMVNPKAANNLKDQLYADARKSRPVDAKISSNKLVNKAEKFEKKLFEGDPDAMSKKKSFELLDKIKIKAKSGEVPITELEEFKININEARSNLYEEFKSNRPGRKLAKRNLDIVSNIVDDALKDYGKANPQWEAFYRPANEVHGAIAQSHKVRNLLLRYSRQLGLPAVAAELGLYSIGGTPAAAGGLAAGGALLGTGEITARFAKSPTLRKHYVNLINSALKEDVVAVKRNLEILDKELQKED